MAAATAERTALENTARVDEVHVVKGFNPRTKVDKQKLQELADSIKENGVLQPVLVRIGLDERYELVAGHRRLAAAKLAGLSYIPIHVQDVSGDGSARIAAVAENVAREDLSPVEEGEALLALQDELAMGVREIARTLGISKDRVSDRIRLAKLSKPIKARVARGDIGLHAVPNIARVAELAPKAAELLVDHARKSHRHNGVRGLEDAATAGSMLADVSKQPQAGLAAAGDGYGVPAYHLGELAMDQALRKDLERRVKTLGPPVKDQWGYSATARKFSFSAKHAAKARDAGALLEMPALYGSGKLRFICDPELIGQFAEQQVGAWERAKASEDKKAAAKAKPGGKAESAEAAEQERKRKEREKEQAARVKAREANLELGRRLREKCATVELTPDLARLLVLLALDNRRGGIADLGLRLVDEDLQQVEVLKNGKQKVTYMKSGSSEGGGPAEAALVRELDTAKTAEEILGAGLRILVAARFADEKAVSPSDRAYYYGPINRPRFGRETDEIGQVLDKLAGQYKVVPAELQR